MKILLLGDLESPYLWDHYKPGKLDGYDFILSTGDLSASYLSFLVTMGRAPVYYVHGNHDGSYEKRPPEGCDCIEDKLITVQGVRILGLGGCMLYSNGPQQYTEAQMRRRIRRLRWKLFRAGGVDIVLTHTPPAGHGDAEDYAHRGFQCFVDLMDRYKPKYWVHSHVHLNYGHDIPRILHYKDTTIINSYERYELELEE